MVVRVEDPAELAEASDGGLAHGPEIPVGWLASLSQAKWRSPLFPEQSSRNGVARRGMAWHGAAWRGELDIARRRSALVSVRGSRSEADETKDAQGTSRLQRFDANFAVAKMPNTMHVVA